ncbi:hypothetical protein JOE57_002299 [Microlunatus panaciterrae]|uniref:Uncharacterized protein n=1 Tax=Microlunatus panaciterrae TaxID=400768 RepID=A0ABS2RK38_9ACTN|nr:hypothetical protein [Microlunatus panaciterrae]
MTAARVAADASGLTAARVRAELTRLLDNLLIGVPSGAETPADFPLRRPMPIDTTALAATSGRSGRRARHRSIVPVPVAGGWSHVLVSREGDAFSVSTVLGGRNWQPITTRTVDLSRLIARIDLGKSSSLLVDEEDRRVQVTWPAIAGAGRWRRWWTRRSPAAGGSGSLMTWASTGRSVVSWGGGARC